MLNYFKNTKQTVKLNISHMEYKYCNRMRSKIQAGLVLHDSTVTWLENLCYPSKLRGNFWFNTI